MNQQAQRRPSSPPIMRPRGAWVPWFVLGVSVLLTAVSTIYVHEMDRTREEMRFRRTMQSVIFALEDRVANYVTMLRGVAALVAAEPQLTLGEFRDYANRLKMTAYYPGIQGIGLTLAVRPDDEPPLVDRMRRQGIRSVIDGENVPFTIWPNEPIDGMLHAIVYLEPMDRRNQAAIGFNMYSEATRREAMARARDTGHAAATGPVTLVQEIDERRQAGFLIYVPLYASGDVPSTLEERRQTLIGFAYSPFRADDLLEATFDEDQRPQIDFDIYDGVRPDPERLLHRSTTLFGPVPAGHVPAFADEALVKVAEREWTLVFRSRPSFEAAGGRNILFLVPPLGLVVGLVLFWATRSEVRARADAERAAEDLRRSRNRLAFLAEASHVLANSLEYDKTLSAITRLAVPELADWCIIYAVGADGQLRRESIAHADPAKATLAAQARAEPLRMDLERNPVVQVARTGQPVLIERLDDEQVRGIAHDDRYLAQVRQAGVRSLVIVPLYVRGGVGGALTLVQAESGRQFTADDVAFVQELGARASSAVENARLYESAREARAEAERANRMKDEFLATVSHELRTPLNAILGWSQLLVRLRDDPETLEQGLETIERNAKAQAQLVEDLLDVSRIITGKLRLDVKRINLEPVIRAAIDTVRPAAEARGIALEADFDKSAGMVLGDPNRLQQVVWNLLSNSIKFTPHGGRVRVSLERAESAVQITVTDTGQGISREFLPQLFTAFRQADGSTTRQHGGLGLGLAIVRHLVELHGGTVSAESDGPGRGAAFRVRLPVKAIAAEGPADQGVNARLAEQQARQHSHVDLEGLRILVVDDEPDAREILRRVLGSASAEVRTVGSAQEALAQLREFEPDLLVSDIGMPGEDGYSLLRKVRSLPREQGGHVPAIALTAFAREEDRRRALAAGFQLHLAKPVQSAELLASIAALAATDADPHA